MKKIMAKYDKQAESQEEHQANIEKRVKDLCEAAKVDYDMYLKALSTSKTGYSVVQKRDLDEIYINSYNIEWIRAWNGNMDIQVVHSFCFIRTKFKSGSVQNENILINKHKCRVSQRVCH